MTDKEKLIDLLKRSSELGLMPRNSGLCRELLHLNILTDNLSLFQPNDEDCVMLLEQNQRTTWWGAEAIKNRNDLFTPLRATVLCFLIAMEE